MKKHILNALIISIFLFSTSCEEFVEIDNPNFQIVNENVFSNEGTALAAMQGVYNQLRPAFFTEAASTHMGMSGNLIKPKYADLNYNPFYNHEISTFDSSDATDNLNIWSSAYNIIYLVNSLIAGVQHSSELSLDLRNSLQGQALVIRAFTYFYLTSFYGDVPLLLSTNYKENAVTGQSTSDMVWSKIRSDLEKAITLLESYKTYPNDQRFNITQNVAIALLARVCLYMEDWVKAEEYSSLIIQNTTSYEILHDLDQVFIKNNREAIWQINPDEGRGRIVTAEGSSYVLHPFILGIIKGDIILSDRFVDEFSATDKRRDQWIGIFEQSDESYPFIHKYKEHSRNLNNIEASVVLRLAEQYLIRSEARLHQEKLELAIKDIDVIRERAGLNLIAITYPKIDKNSLLDSIMVERKKELFGEYGHYWLDLKRTDTAPKQFSDNPSWEDTDIWYPIPEQERLKNPNLGQNEGY